MWPFNCPGRQVGHVQFGRVVVVDNQNEHGGMEEKVGKQSSSSSSYANANNLHESEMPMTFSVVS